MISLFYLAKFLLIVANVDKLGRIKTPAMDHRYTSLLFFSLSQLIVIVMAGHWDPI